MNILKIMKIAAMAMGLVATAQTQAANITFGTPVSAYNESVLDTPYLAGGTLVQGVTHGAAQNHLRPLADKTSPLLMVTPRVWASTWSCLRGLRV